MNIEQPSGGAQVGLAANFARGGRVARVVVPVIFTGTILSDRSRYRRPSLALLACAVAGMETAWVIKRSAKVNAWEDLGLALAETAVGALSQVLEFYADPFFSTNDARPLDQFVQFLSVSAAMAHPSRIGATASSGALAAGSVISAARERRGQLKFGSSGSVGLGISFTTNAISARLFYELLIGTGLKLDSARAERILQTERLEREKERERQHRIAHDSALQLLEAIAGNWKIEDSRILELIDAEVVRIERMLSGRQGITAMFAALSEVAERARMEGLVIDLTIDDHIRGFQGPFSRVLPGALGEALTNIRKHAGTNEATVRVVVEGTRIKAVVTDMGCGFNREEVSAGFGLMHSIEDALLGAGGEAVIESNVGSGTTITMWLPK